MKKIICLILLLLLCLPPLTACQKTADTVRVWTLNGTTGFGMAPMIAAADKSTYTFTVEKDATVVRDAIINGTADIAAVPTNLASTLYKKTEGKVQVLALNTLGVLHILTNGEEVNSVADLKGKTIYTSGQGANPEYILRYVLQYHGIDADKDVKLEFVADNDTLATVIANGTAKVAMVPEPKASAVLMQNKNVKRLWSRILRLCGCS